MAQITPAIQTGLSMSEEGETHKCAWSAHEHSVCVQHEDEQAQLEILKWVIRTSFQIVVGNAFPKRVIGSV